MSSGTPDTVGFYTSFRRFDLTEKDLSAFKYLPWWQMCAVVLGCTAGLVVSISTTDVKFSETEK